MLSPGDKIGPYTIRERAGQGGMAVVYQAWHEGLHRLEALKVPRGAGQISSDSAYIQRLLAEARVAAGLHHPHIVAIHGVSEPLAPIPFFAMDWVQGRDLSQILAQKGAFSLGETIQILEKVAAALDYAHGRGVVHRDIKPANILLSEEGEILVPKVVDFGISRAAEDDDIGGETKLTRSGMIVGTPEYMSPEQAGSGEKVDFRTDIYSLGIVAYEMLCGAPPFTAGSGVSRLSILISQVRDIAPLWEKFPAFPPASGAVILGALAKMPDQRPQSCADFIAQLKATGTDNEDFLVLHTSEGRDAEHTPFDESRFERDDSATIFERPISLSDTPPPGPPPTLLPRSNGSETALETPLETPTSANYSLRARLEAAQTPAPVFVKETPFQAIASPVVLAPAVENEKLAANFEKEAPKLAVSKIGSSRVAVLTGFGGVLVGGFLVLALWGRDSTSLTVAEAGASRAGSDLAKVIAPPSQTKAPSLAPNAANPVPLTARLPVAPPTSTPRLRVVKVVRTSPLVYPTSMRTSSRRALGTRFIAQRGQNGARQTTLQISYQGEREVARRVLAQRVTRQPTAEIIVVGTRRKASPPRFDLPRESPVRSARPTARTSSQSITRQARTQSAPRRETKPKKAKSAIVKRRAVREAPLPP